MSQRSRLARALTACALALGTMVAVAACSGSADGTDQSAQAADLDTAAFAERVATHNVVVLDVRTPAEYASGHLADAVNIDVESASFDSQIAELDPTAAYAIYCRSGNRSAVAMSQMAQAGFTDLAHLTGGITAWVDAGHPVEQ